MNSLVKILFALYFVFLVSQNAYSQTCDWTLYNNTNSGLPANYVDDMEIDHDGNIWFATYNGLAVFDADTTWIVHDTSTGLTENMMSVLKVDNNGNMWAGSYSGLYKFNNSTWSNFNTLNSLILGDDIVDIASDNFGKLWITTGMGAKSGGVQYFDGNNTWATFTQTDGLVSDDIRDIAVDINDNIWFSSDNSLDTGITRRSLTGWTTYQYADTIPLQYINGISSDLDGNVWIISDLANGVIKFDGVNAEIFNESNSPLFGYANCVKADYNGNIWIGTSDGALKYDGTFWQTFNTSNSGLPENNIMDIEFDLDGNIWFATLNSGIAKLSVKADLEVHVVYNGSMIDFNDVYLELYSPSYPAVDGSDSLFAVTENFVQFNFMFEDIEPGNYYLKAVVKPGSIYTDMINSYYVLEDTSFMWNNATIISLDDCDFQNVVLNMADFPISMNIGNGTFSGNISFDNGGTKLAGEPVPGAEVYIEQEPNDQPVVTQKSDSLGNFIFDNIPTGNTFKIYIDIPGFPMMETYTNLEITTTEIIIENLDYLVDTSGIYIDENSSVIELNNQYSLNIYPNPSTDYFTLEYNLTDKSEVNISFIDEHGKVIKTICNDKLSSGLYSHLVTTENFSPGVYFVNIQIGNTTYLKKLILAK